MLKLFRSIKHKIGVYLKLRKFPNIQVTSDIPRKQVRVYNRLNLIMEERTNIDAGATIMNTRAKFIMKKYSGAAIGLMVITGNHMSLPGFFVKQVTDSTKDKLDKNGEYDQDVIVEEDVWIGANVTLLSGSMIGRGAIVGNGSVVRGKVPPYAIVMGNPAKVVGFKFTPEETIEHEKKLYAEKERINSVIIEKNYEKYFLSRTKEIKQFVKL